MLRQTWFRLTRCTVSYGGPLRVWWKCWGFERCDKPYDVLEWSLMLGPVMVCRWRRL